MKNIFWQTVIIFIAFNLACLSASAQAPTETAFKLFVIGSGGGIDDGNLNCYLLAAKNSNEFISLDAGTLYSGIQKTVDAGKFYDVFIPSETNLTKTGYIFTECIKGYLISHPHLDHIAGLVIASPADQPKPVYGSETTIRLLTENIFNWKIWPNFTSGGEGLQLKKYTLQTVKPGEEFRIGNTSFKTTPFVVSHQEPYASTAYLLENYGEYLLYIGDTGSDELENTSNLQIIWQSIAPIIRQHRLHAIMMECSYPNAQPDLQLYGHLNPKWMLKELENLAKEVNPDNPETALTGLTVVVTGIKPMVFSDIDPAHQISMELLQVNKPGVSFVFPVQGQRIEL